MNSNALLLKVAEMYYYEKLSQREISLRLGLSIPTVSRLLKEAFNKGIVQVKIENIEKRLFQMEKELEKKFSLEKAIVIDLNVQIDQWSSKKILAKEASKIITNFFSPGDLIGIGPGETIFEMISSLSIETKIPNIRIIPLMGGWGIHNVQYETNKLAIFMAYALGCDFYLLTVPAFVSSPYIKEKFLNEPQIRECIKKWEEVKVAIFSIGPEIEYSILPLIAQDNTLINEVKRRGGVSDILGRIINEDGEELDIFFNKCLISIDFNQLLRIPIRIGIGGVSKIRGIKASLKKGIINILITDREACTYLLEKGG